MREGSVVSLRERIMLMMMSSRGIRMHVHVHTLMRGNLASQHDNLRDQMLEASCGI
jgi:hypothetical protein